jgi:hypothetical protein
VTLVRLGRRLALAILRKRSAHILRFLELALSIPPYIPLVVPVLISSRSQQISSPSPTPPSRHGATQVPTQRRSPDVRRPVHQANAAAADGQVPDDSRWLYQLKLYGDRTITFKMIQS